MEIRSFRMKGLSRHTLSALTETVLISALTGYLFYKSFWGGALAFALMYKSIGARVRALEEREKALKRKAFGDFLSVLKRLSASGLSLHQSLIRSGSELRMLYPEEDAWIIKSLEQVLGGLVITPNIGRQFFEWGERDGIQEISDFGRIVEVVQSYGGDLPEMVRTSAAAISERLETESEIRLMAASKMFEQKVMFFLGYAMVALLNSVMEDIFQSLYMTWAGRAVMTVSLCMMLAGRSLGLKLAEVEV